MITAAIRCNASRTLGMGHVVRQRHLGALLRNHGIKLDFYVSDHPPTLDMLTRHQFSYRVVDEDEGLPSDYDDKYDLLILDLRSTDKEFIHDLRHRAEKIVSIEDVGSGRNEVDLLIDANLTEEDTKQLPANVQILFGLSYCLLAPEFADFHMQSKSFSSAPGSVLVSMGGTDPNRLTLKLARFLCGRAPDSTLTFIAGPGYNDLEELQRIVSPHPSCNILTGVDNMAELLFCHRMVLCAGGVTMHEALAVGTPAIVISQVPHQEQNAQAVEKFGAVVNLGLADGFDCETLLHCLNFDADRLQSMSTAGKKLIDGRGLQRVASVTLDPSGVGPAAKGSILPKQSASSTPSR